MDEGRERRLSVKGREEPVTAYVIKP